MKIVAYNSIAYCLTDDQLKIFESMKVDAAEALQLYFEEYEIKDMPPIEVSNPNKVIHSIAGYEVPRREVEAFLEAHRRGIHELLFKRYKV